MKEDVVFDEMPEDNLGYGQSSGMSVSGKTATRTVTRTVKLSDGTEKVLTKTESRTFD